MIGTSKYIYLLLVILFVCCSRNYKASRDTDIQNDSILNCVCNNDTLIIKRSFLMSDNLVYSKNDSVISFSNIDKNKLLFDICCCSNKYHLKDDYYLIQFISKSGSSRYIAIGNSNKLELFILHNSNDFHDRTSVNDFLQKIKSKCNKEQYQELDYRLNLLTQMNQKKFPVFPYRTNGK